MNTISGQGADPALPVTAVQPFPAGFRTQDIQVKGVALYVRIGGEGSAVVLLHGYGETGDMWTPLAAELARDHTVIAPDLRGMGLTSRPVGGYDKKTQDHDIAGMLDALQIRLQVELICNLSLPPPRPMGSCYRADAAGAAIAKRLGISELKLRRFEKRLVAAQQSGPPPSEPARAVVSYFPTARRPGLCGQHKPGRHALAKKPLATPQISGSRSLCEPFSCSGGR